MFVIGPNRTFHWNSTKDNHVIFLIEGVEISILRVSNIKTKITIALGLFQNPEEDSSRGLSISHALGHEVNATLAQTLQILSTRI